MKNKVIGIPGYKIGDNGYGVGANYLEFARHYGNPRIIMPWEEKVNVDLLILPGGLDTAPMNYGQTPNYHTSNQDVHKEFFFLHRLDNYIGNTPIFGICLGFQMLAVKFGSTLTQDLSFHPHSSDRWTGAHTVKSPLFSKAVEVNSHHHQAVLKENLGKSLISVAEAPMEDDFRSKSPIVEAFIHRELKIGGVQWHPEEWYDGISDTIIVNFLNDADPRAEQRLLAATSS